MASKHRFVITTETERVLLGCYQQEKVQREKLESLVDELKTQIKELKDLLDQTCSNQKKGNNPSSDMPLSTVQYETDEEDLARETEWVRQISRKKRKLNKSPSPQKAEDCNQEKPKVKKTPLPPPIVVEKIQKYQKFFDFISSSVAKETFTTKVMSGDNIKINCTTDESYRAITKLLTENGQLWHSYENKQERPIRVMAKNLHSSCLPERITEDLILQGFKIINATNKLSWRNKKPLNMFMISFEKEEDINKIYGIKTILGCKVDIQPIKTSKLIPQCKRCQAYGHTQKYCSKEPRCVKCTGKHLTRDCDKPAESKPKCVHCGEAHPANYRGCMVAKELQSLKNKTTKKSTPKHVIQVPSGSKPRAVNLNQVNSKITYSQVAKGDVTMSAHQQQVKQVSPSIDEKLNQILHLITSFDERLKKLESSAKNALPQHTS